MNKAEQKNGKRWLVVLLPVLIIAVFALFLGQALSEKEPASVPPEAPTATQSQSLPKISSEPDTEVQDTLPATRPVEVTEPSSVKPEPDETEPTSTTTVPEQIVPPEQQLSCELYSIYSGAYVEDGSDEPVENVAALLIRNGSSQYLDLAQLTYDLDGREAIFTVTGLPSGASAWVLEENRLTADADTKFTHKNTLTSFRNDAVNDLEDLELAFNGTMLKATNTSDQPLQNVTVYYKTLHEDGNFLGGITYMTTFGDLEPGQSAEKIAGHFQPDKTQIVRISYSI